MAIDGNRNIQAESLTKLPPPRVEGNRAEQDPEIWWRALKTTVAALLCHIRPNQIRALAVDGTSGTLLLCDADGLPLTPALMYNDARAAAEAERIAELGEETAAAAAPTSSLAKFLHLRRRVRHFRHALHQADWITGTLTGQFGLSDENNALKLGYDPINRCWPHWLRDLNTDPEHLPQVKPPGELWGPLCSAAATDLGLDPHTLVASGTTDSVAGFLAGGSCRSGSAVTSLGSTLVVKIVSRQPIFCRRFGVYSQRMQDLWLAGGASNSGGAVLKHYFGPEQLRDLTAGLRPGEPTGYDYYPLIRPGERFPLQDPQWPPRLTPRPKDDRVFFQAMLEGMARIEQRAYRRLAQLGAPGPQNVQTVGGGASNPGWTEIRRLTLGVPVHRARQTEAAFGTALLARRSTMR